MQLLGGFVGVSQDPGTLALRPEIGWAVRPMQPAPDGVACDLEADRRVAHVVFAGPRGPTLDAELELAREATGATWVAAAGRERAWFDVPASASSIVRVHDGSASDAVPAAVVLVVGEPEEDWAAVAARHARLERVLLASGRLQSTRIVAVMGETDAAGLATSRAALPAIWSAHQHGALVLWQLSAAGDLLKEIRDRLAGG